jgi:hypothetical protein
MFAIEMESKDDLQNDVTNDAQTLTNLCTTYTRANRLTTFDKSQLDIVREYNYLVESNFKTKHQVADYAEMLNKVQKHYLIYSKYNENHLYKLFKTARYLKHADYYATLTRYQRNRLRNRLRRQSFSRFSRK